VELVLVCRDKKWIKLPYILLVKGDLIFSRTKKRLNYYDLNFEIYNTKEGTTNIKKQEGFYKLKETLIKRIIRECFPPYIKLFKRPVDFSIEGFSKTFSIMTIMGLLLTLGMNGGYLILNYFYFKKNVDWIELLFDRPVFVIIFLLPCAFPILWTTLNGIFFHI
jgi:hypothetical protein